MVLLILYWAISPSSSPIWTGLGPYDGEVSGPRARTLWDWMELLIVPVVLSIGVWWLNKSDKDTEREIAQQKDTTEREIALERQWQATLEAYFDRMTDLLLHESLRSSCKGEVQTIARTRTLVVMRDLDRVRKGQVIRFLYKSGLLGQENPIISVIGADLVETDLGGAKLPEVNLCNAQFIRANLCHADLTKAAFADAQLIESDLRGVNLTKAILLRTDLSKALLEDARLDEADLRNANLSGTNLRKASLFKANLSGANLEGADLRDANLHEANLTNAELTGAQLSGYGRTHLRGANLMGATLVNANLNGVELLEANLMGANLIGATLIGANLRRANLSEATLGSKDDLKTVKSLDGATLPDGTKHDGRVLLSTIASSHILQAIKVMDKMHVYRRFEEPLPEYILIHKGEWYPLDYLVPLAYESEDGLPHDVFDGGEAHKHLTALGFVVHKTIDTIPSGQMLPNKSLHPTALSRFCVRVASRLRRFSSRLVSLREPRSG